MSNHKCDGTYTLNVSEQTIFSPAGLFIDHENILLKSMGDIPHTVAALLFNDGSALGIIC